MSGAGVPKVWRRSGGPTFTKQFELSVDDHWAVRNSKRKPLPFALFCAFVTLFTLGAGLTLAFDPWNEGKRWIAVGIVAASALAGLILSWLLHGFFRSMITGFWEGFLQEREAVNVPFELTVDRSGVSVLVRQQSWFCPWESILDVEEDEERYYFWITKTTAHILPKRLFEKGEEGENEQFEEGERERFDEALRDWLGRAPTSPPRRTGLRVENWGK